MSEWRGASVGPSRTAAGRGWEWREHLNEMGKGRDRGRGRLQRGAFTWLRAGGGGCQAVAGLVVVIPVQTVLTPHGGSPHQKGPS